MISTTELKTTPLLEEHKRLGARLAPFGGWLMPIQYAGIIAEHLWTRTQSSLFDICHMGEFIVRGEPGKTGLDRIVTVDLAKQPLGSCRYGFMLNDEGGIIDDIVVYKITPDRWMVVVNAATIPGDEAHIRKHLARGAAFENASDTLAKLDLQGPLSGEVAAALLGARVKELGYYTFGRFDILGEECIVSRTGYTGELGYEFYISARKAEELWKKLLSDGRVKPAGLGCRDTLRLEMCYPLYGQDIDASTTPDEAGLGRFVSPDKEFIGKEALLARRASLARTLLPFISVSRRSPRHNYAIYSGDTKIGHVTSGSFSPSLSCGVALGYIDPVFAKTGREVTLKEGDIEIKATITGKPFYTKGTARP